MDKSKFRLRFALSLWLPVFAVLLSAAIVLVPAIRVYLRWKASIGSGDMLMLTAGKFQMMIPREHMLRSAVEMNAMREQGTISMLNAPGHLLGALASQLLVHHANGFPDSLGPFLWRVLSTPLFAIPAWFFAGRGIDGLLLRRRMRLPDLVLSVIFVVLSLALSAGLRFGLSESERAGDVLSVSYVFGFAWWSLLFAFPLSAWVRQRLRKVNTA
jgi:hypothetical protein